MNKSIVLTILILLSLTIVAIAASSEISLTITSSDPTQNDTTNDLTLESINVDPSIDVYRFNWLKDGQSFAVLNMPFEGSDLISQEDISRRGNAPSGYGDAAFSSGTGYDGNGSLYFNGSAQVDIDDSTDINVGIHTEKTVEFWFKASTDFSSSDKQVLYEEGGVARGFNLYLSNGALYLGAWNNVSSESNWTGTFLSSPVNQDQYYHVAAVLDNAGPTVEADKLKLYIDGALVASGDASQLWTHYGDINVGAKTTTIFHDEPESYGSGSFFVGYLDELRIYDDALVLDQIAEHSKGNYPFMDAELTDGFETWQLEAIPLQVSSAGPYYPSNEIQVLPVNTAPTANDDTFTVAAGNVLSLDVLANDVDAEGDALSVTSVGTATEGIVSLEADGSVLYTAPTGFLGTDTFSYDMEGVRGGSDSATVTVTIVASDTTAPTISAYEPENDVVDRDIIVRVQAQDDVAVDTVRLILEEVSTRTAVLDVEMSPEASDNYFSYSIAASSLAAGTYTVNVTANDTSVDVGGPNEAEQTWILNAFDGSATVYTFVGDPNVSGVSTSTATVSAETTVPTSQFTLFYATSEVDLNATPNSQQLNLTGFSGDIALSSLAASTQYFYYVNGTSYDGRLVQSTTGTFTTSDAPVESTNTGGGSSFSGSNRRTACSDGQDNDNDGLTDLNDPDCSSQNDNSERGSFGLPTQEDEDVDSTADSGSNLSASEDAGNEESIQEVEDALNNGLTGAVVSDGTQGASSAAARTTILVLVALVVAGLLGWFVYVKVFAAKKQ